MTQTDPGPTTIRILAIDDHPAILDAIDRAVAQSEALCLACGANAKGSNAGASLGPVKVARFFQPEPYVPPYSMNHRYAVRGLRADWLVDWSAATTNVDTHASSGPRPWPAARNRSVGADFITKRRDLADESPDLIVQRRDAECRHGAHAFAP